MEKPKSEHGGPRPGAGRKPINDAPMAINLVVRVTPELRDKIKRLGGSAWVRRMAEKAKEPKNG